jgi:TolB-like protein/predicted Zn-dependent protease
MALSAGTPLGAYRIVGPLGAGGMGEVYRAHDPRLARDVALKLLPADMAGDPSRLERFTREARAIAALNHPHIITIYSTEEADGVRFLTMELVEGQSLDALIPPTGLPLTRFLELALPLADALTAAHQKQITHRDLKPANVMVASDGRVKVLDFGLARVSGPLPSQQTIEATRAVLTSEGTIVGTMPYMSPEQIEGRPLDQRTDLFSLGVMFHEMLTGARPFGGESSAQLMSSILRDTPSSASDIRPDVPDTLSRLIHRCLEKRPEDRVQTARDIYNELKHVQKQLESGPARARSDSGSGRVAVAESAWIAVLPFTTRTNDPDAQALASGLTEDITSGLSLFPSLSVVALHTARSFKDSPLDARQIAERLNARYIMGGSVRKSAAGVRIAVHLIDAHSGLQLWSDTYDHGAEHADIYAVQDDVTDRVVSTVADKAGVLARSMAQATQGIAIDRLSAHQLVYRCWGFEARPTAAEHAELRSVLETFVARVPNDGELWAELGQVYVAEHCLLFNPLPDSLGRGLRASRRAIEIDRTNQRGWVVLASACFFNRDEPGFTEAADRVLKLNPRNSNAIAWMGTLTAHMGQYDRGCALVDRAMALNSAHPGWYHFAHFNREVARRDFQAALRSARRVNVPDFMWMHLAIAAAAGQLGLAADGRAAVETLEALVPPLADEARLREFLTRWFWDDQVVEDMVAGVRKSKEEGAATPLAALAPGAHAGAAAPARVTRPSDPGSDSRPVRGDTWIAVVPFSTSGSDDESRTLADGLTEDVTAGLSRFPYLSVVAAHTARQQKSAGTDARQLGAALGARYLLDGSIRRAGHALRVGVRLVDSHSGAQLWSDTYARDIQAVDLLALQDDLTDRIVATVADVHGVLMRSMSQEAATLGLSDADPRVLRFRYWAYQRQHTAVEHSQLRDAFEAVAAREAGLAPIWAALANLYWHEHGFAYNVRPDALARARQAATRALELDPLLQHAWEALATVYFFEHDREAFTHALDRALALNPRNANAMAMAGVLLVHADELDRGAALTERAMALNPDHPGWYHMARANRDYAEGDDENALRAAKRINMPDHVWAHFLVALAAGQLGRTGDATTALEAVFRLAPPFADEAVVVDRSQRWKWNAAHVDRMLDGYRKATALRATALALRRAQQPTSDSTTAPAANGALAATAFPSVAPFASTASSPASGLSSTAATGAGALAIAVQLFSSRGGDSAADLAEGLTEDVTTGLARFSYLRVVPRAAETAAAVPARYVLEGQVRVAQSAVRVSARLTDTISGAHLWAENYDRPAEAGVFALQDDIAPRIIATVGDANGVLLRSMVTTLKQRPIEEHTVRDLVLRFHGFLEHFDPAEHLQLRDRLTEALRHEPGHADGWACLSSLIEHEYSHGLNPRPDPLGRARDAAERSVAADPVCQEGWRGMASAAFFARDAAGVRLAAERAIAINPLNTGTVAVCGLFLAYSGAWDRGLDVIRQAMQPNPHYPGWVHFPICSYHIKHGDYTAALQQVKQINMPRFPKWHLTIAAVAGHLGLRDEARAALDGLARLDPARSDDDYVRQAFASWIWTDDEMERLVDGVRKARALVASGVSRPLAAGAPASSDTVRRDAAPNPPSSGSDTADASIAVLPFRDLSEERNQDWFCDGIAEEILNALTQLPGLHVAARTSTFSFRNSADDLHALGEKLGVATVVQGSVRRAGERIRVTVQLVDVSNGFQLWSDRYDRELKDIFDVQDEIARAVANRLKVASTTASGARLVMAATSNLVAYEHYLQGRALLYRRGASILPALEHFRQAVELDANYAQAWAGIADAYVVSAYFGLVRGTEARRQGLAAARQALALDAASSDAHTALAGLAQICENDLRAARAGYETALELNPSHIQGRCWYALFYLQAGRGRYAEGVAEARRARELDPLSAWVAAILAVTLVTAGDTEEAVLEARRATALDPLSFVARWVLGLTLRYAGRLDEAESALAEAAATSGRHHFAIVSLALTCAHRGQSDRALALHAELVQRAAAGYIPLTQLSLTADAAGDRNQALAYARQALDQREPPFVLLARHWPEFRELRQDARFAALLRELDDPWPVDDDR